MPENPQRPDPKVFQFGAFVFNPARLELTRDGLPIRLPNQAARLLQLLLSKQGDLVTREAIQDLLWKDGTTVDFEIGVNRCIRKLRSALLDQADTPRYIKTIPRVGYRFIAPLSFAGSVLKTEPAASTDAGDASTERPGESPSIAVLPFLNLSDTPDGDCFADGLTEEVINGLAQIPGLKVIARTSAFAFKGTREEVPAIAAKLQVGNVLEGSFRRSGTRIRVSAQLIRGSDGVHLLSKRYDREIDDIFAVQDEISGDIAAQLSLRFALRRHKATGLSAFEAFVEGRHYYYRFTKEAFAKAFDRFQYAASCDPQYAPAYSGMALCYLGRAISGQASPREVLPQAAEMARQALDRDRANAQANGVLGSVAAILDFDFQAAEQHLLRALELQAASHIRIGYSLWVLVPALRAEEAEAQLNHVIEQDPLLQGGFFGKAVLLGLQRRYEESVAHALRAQALEPAYERTFEWLACMRALQNRPVEAAEYVQRLTALTQNSLAALFATATAQVMAKDTAAVRTTLDEMKRYAERTGTGACEVACIHALMGAAGDAFEWLDTAVEQREPRTLWIQSLPWLDSIRADTRYPALLRRMRLADA